MNRSVSDEALRPQGDPESAGQGLLQRAWKRVRANKGAAGVDGLDIEQTAEHLLPGGVAGERPVKAVPYAVFF